ncbi:hypothetical protein [Myroides sp. LJL119]
MKRNLTLLLVGLFIFALSLILESQGILNQTTSTIGLILALIISVIALMNLVYKNLRK